MRWIRATAPGRLRAWLPVAVWMALIYLFSDQPDLPQAADPTLDFVIKKALHATAYGILALLCYRALRWRRDETEAGRAARPLSEDQRAAVIALLIAVAYAVTDEWHQLHVPGRHGLARDVVIDSVGAVVGLAGARKRIDPASGHASRLAKRRRGRFGKVG